MKKTIFLAAILIGLSSSLSAQDSANIRRGWTFGILPSFAYDADLGLQLGLLTNVYYFGDGAIYPDYYHSFYAEAATTSKHYGLFRLSYDSKYLIPNHRLSIDISYLPDQMCDFYGFNGFESYLIPGYSDPSSNQYKTRAYYKFHRDMFRFSADLQGTISKPWYWNAGLGLLSYNVGPVDVARLNKYTKKEENKLPEGVTTLYNYYFGSQTHLSNHPYIHGGVTFDTRDRQQNPRRGIHADAFLTYYRHFSSESGLLSNGSRNNLKFNASWRHYIPLIPSRLTFAYRVGTQLNLAGQSPFYIDSYLNQLYMQRVIYEGLGGANSLRGILRNRVVAPGVAFANVEFRGQVAHFRIGKENFYIGLNPFMDAGMVLQPYKDVPSDFSKLNFPSPADDDAGCLTGYMDQFYSQYESSVDKTRLYSPHLSAGCGLKVAMNDNFVLSVDWATALDKQDNNKFSNLYIKMGYMF